jgi:hypothetical protein
MWTNILETLIMTLKNNIHYLIALGWITIRFQIVWKYESDIIVYISSIADKDEDIIMRKYRDYLILKILQILYEGFMIATLLGSYTQVEIVIGNSNNNKGDFL